MADAVAVIRAMCGSSTERERRKVGRGPSWSTPGGSSGHSLCWTTVPIDLKDSLRGPGLKTVDPAPRNVYAERAHGWGE